MDSVPVEAIYRDHTLDSITAQLEEAYVYGDLVADSTNNGPINSQPCGFTQYNSQIDVLADALTLREANSMGSFFSGLQTISNSLLDAHSFIVLPQLVTYVNVASYGSRLNPNGDQVFFVKNIDWERNLLALFMHKDNMTQFMKTVVDKPLDTINGLSPVDYLDSVAKSWPGYMGGCTSYKDKAVRINCMLNTGLQAMPWIAPDNKGVVEWAFSDGTTATERVFYAKLLFVNGGDHQQYVESLQSYVKSNPFFDMLNNMFNLNAALLKDARQRRMSTTQEPRQLQKPRRYLEDECTCCGDGMSKTQITIPHVFKELADCSSGGCDVLIDHCSWTSSDDTLIERWYSSSLGGAAYVIRTSPPDGSLPQVILKVTGYGEPNQLMPFARLAVELTKSMPAEKRELLIDTISNGGGDTQTGSIFLTYLFGAIKSALRPDPSFANIEQLCSWGLMRVSDDFYALAASILELDSCLDSGSSDCAFNPRDPTQAATFGRNLYTPQNQTDEIFEQLRQTDEIFDIWNISWDCTSGQMIFHPAQSDTCAAKKLYDALTNLNTFAEQLINAWPGMTDEERMEAWKRERSNLVAALGMGPSQVYPTRDPSAQGSSLTYLHPGQQLRRGGKTSQYSSYFTIPSMFSGCPAKWTGEDRPSVDEASILPIPPQEIVKRIKFISDGMTGSTGSVVPTTAYTYGLADVVTFGGIQGQPHDISSFNGGNVNKWNHWWPAASISSYAFHTLFEESAAASFQVLMPLPGRTSASYAQTAQVLIDQFGENTLPREWYLVSSQTHLDWWPTVSMRKLESPLEDQTAWDQLVSLYKQAAATEPQYLQCIGGERVHPPSPPSPSEPAECPDGCKPVSSSRKVLFASATVCPDGCVPY